MHVMQDASWIAEEAGLGGQAFEDVDRWHSDLLRAWDSNLPSKMEEAIA